MNRLKKAMALGMMSVMVVSSASFAESPQDPYVMTESMGSNLISGSNDTSQSDSLPIILSQQAPSGPQADLEKPWEGKIKSFRGSVFVQQLSESPYPAVQTGDKDKPVYLLIDKVIKDKKDGDYIPFRADQFELADQCTIELYDDPSFKKIINEERRLGDAFIPLYVKVSEEKPGDVKKEFFFVLNLSFDNAPNISPIFNKEPNLSDDSIKENGNRYLRMQITLDAENDKNAITKRDITTKDDQLSIEFFGQDSSFLRKEEGAVQLNKEQPTSVYFYVKKDGGSYYYELEINRSKQQPHTGGSSPQSSVRPDSSSSAADKKSGTKNDMKKDAKNDMKQDAKKMDEKKSDMKNVDQNKSSAESKVSTKLMIGETKYTVVVDGVAIEKTADVAPTVHMGRTLLPARMISEILGVTVKFESATKMASFMYGENNKVELTLGQKYMLVNGQKMELTADILNQDGRILLPLKDIQNAFTQLGLKSNISWDSASKSVNIEK